jgi:hypothetical protein
MAQIMLYINAKVSIWPWVHEHKLHGFAQFLQRNIHQQISPSIT